MNELEYDSFLKGVMTGRQLKGWAEAGMEQYHAWGFRNMQLVGHWASECGYLSAADTNYSNYKMDGIYLRKNSESNLDGASSKIFPRFDRPFEVSTVFRLADIPESGKYSIVFGSDTSANSIYYEFCAPQLVVHDDEYFEFIYSSYVNNQFQHYTINMGGNQYPGDYLPIVPSRAYRAISQWTGEKWICSIQRDNIKVIKSLPMTNGHYRRSDATLMFGNNLTRSVALREPTVQNLEFFLPWTYIKINKKLYWGFTIGDG